MFYEFTQNNSYGYFDVTDTVCHRLFIEADSVAEAMDKAEELGCYWNGVTEGIDCPCCGDRWYGCAEIDLEKLQNGYEVVDYDNKKDWYENYGKYTIVEPPQKETVFSKSRWVGKIAFSSIEEYAQYLANEYGWTTPDIRIFYKDGRVTEIFKEV